MQLEEDRLDELVAEGMSAPAEDDARPQGLFPRAVPAAARAGAAAGLGAAQEAQGRGDLRGPRFGRQGRRHQARHPAAQSARLPRRGAARADRARAQPVVLPALRPASADGRRNGAVRPLLVQPRRRRARHGLLHAGRARGVLPLGARVRAHAGALGHHPDQILVLDHRRGAGIPLQDAHPRSAEAVEAVADGHGKPRPLGGLHQGQGRDAGSAPTPRTRRGGWSRPSTRRRRGSTASPICSTQIPYEDVPKPEIELPERVRHADYVRQPVPPEMYVPEVY